MITKLYEKDFNLWREVIIKQIKDKNFQAIDWENLLIELEDMGKSEKRAFISNLTILIAHLVKLMIQKDATNSMKISWYNSITEHRFRIETDLKENPSFKYSIEESMTKAYKQAKRLAIKEGQKSKFGVRKPLPEEYPNLCPFTLQQLLDEDFYGD